MKYGSKEYFQSKNIQENIQEAINLSKTMMKKCDSVERTFLYKHYVSRLKRHKEPDIHIGAVRVEFEMVRDALKRKLEKFERCIEYFDNCRSVFNEQYIKQKEVK